MSREKKNDNVEIGMRLRAIRMNLGMSQSEFAEILEISDDHYRKVECGSSGLTVEKVKLLYESLSIDPTYLIIGERMDEFDLERYLVNCSKEQKNKLFKHCLAYIEKYITK